MGERHRRRRGLEITAADFAYVRAYVLMMALGMAETARMLPEPMRGNILRELVLPALEVGVEDPEARAQLRDLVVLLRVPDVETEAGQ